VKILITQRRHETLSLHNILDKVKLKVIPWLALPRNGKAGKIPLSDSKKRKRLFAEFIYWVFAEALIPLLRTSFFVTETGPYKNAVW
jgi:telomerase reverse transcriptase